MDKNRKQTPVPTYSTHDAVKTPHEMCRMFFKHIQPELDKIPKEHKDAVETFVWSAMLTAIDWSMTTPPRQLEKWLASVRQGMKGDRGEN